MADYDFEAKAREIAFLSAGYFDSEDDEEYIVNMTKDVARVLREAYAAGEAAERERCSSGIERLQHDLTEYINISTEQQTEIERLKAELRVLYKLPEEMDRRLRDAGLID